MNTANFGQANNFLSGEDFFLRVAKGHIPGHSYIEKFGYNKKVEDKGLEEIWEGEGEYPWQTTAQQLNISSSNNQDTVAGTGARQVSIQGLDANYDLISETIDLSGGTAVTTASSFLRVFRCKVTQVGSDGYNRGIIEFQYATTNDVAALIDLNENNQGNNQTLMALYTIPNGKTGYFYKWYYSHELDKKTYMGLRVRESTSDAPFQIKKWNFGATSFFDELKIPLVIPHRSDISLVGLADGGGRPVSGGFTLLLVDS